MIYRNIQMDTPATHKIKAPAMREVLLNRMMQDKSASSNRIVLSSYE